MVGTPNYGFNRHPSFTVNHISEYLTTDGATQRTRIIRAAKFPKKVEVAAYGQIRRPLQLALSKPDFDQPNLEMLSEKMAAKARREIGYARDEALRCERAIKGFLDTIKPRSFSRMEISPAPSALEIRESGVRLRVTLDAAVTCEAEGVTNCGGIVLLYAFSADRGSMEHRLKAITGLMLWALEGGQMEPLPRLCMAADIAEQEIMRASPSHTRFRAQVAESCQEIAARWDLIEPPEDYDGPDWR